MATYLEDKERNIIPRWRDFLTTLVLGELSAIGSSFEVQGPSNTRLIEQIYQWESHRTVSFAADLVGSALVVGASDPEITEAAKFLLSNSSDAPQLAKELAAQILSPDDRTRTLPPQELPSSSFDDLKLQSAQQIRGLRKRLLDEPRNSILLADLARQYTVLGLKKKAERAMRTAVRFGSENRFILRSAARLYVHQGDPDQAHSILRRSRSTRQDPWLLAAEIAVAAAASKTSSNVKLAKKVLDDDNYSAFETTELASAIATLEMFNSNSKGAKKLFRRALRAPTENTVAQAEWASRQILSNFEIELDSVPPRIYEARAWELFTRGDWENSFEQSMKWLYDQSFSVRPVLLSGYIASTVFEDFELSTRILQFGLVSNPEDDTVLSNLAFSLASANRVEEARHVFDRIDRAALDEGWRIVVKATEGLLRYREGFPEEGRNLYTQAINEAESHHDKSLRGRAAIYLAREEILANSSRAREAIQLAFRLSNVKTDESIPVLLKRLRQLQLEHSID